MKAILHYYLYNLNLVSISPSLYYAHHSLDYKIERIAEIIGLGPGWLFYHSYLPNNAVIFQPITYLLLDGRLERLLDYQEIYGRY